MTDKLPNIPLTRIDGEATDLLAFRGKVLLVVNVASKCGLTPQYEGLERLYEEKRAAGLEILGFPANNFRSQEPGNDGEIAAFCATTYHVQFPLFSKISVKGDDQHPLYRHLTEVGLPAVGDGPMRERLAGYGIEVGGEKEVLWNFEKFLIGRDGALVGRFAPDVPADDPRLVAAIDQQLSHQQ
jgi:glutathione peroxidase